MWTKPIQFGGVVGGNSTMNEGEGYYTGSSYNPRFANAIIMQGTLFYQEPYGNSGGGGDYVSVDLQTGKENWRINCSATGVSLVPTFGYLYGFEDGNQHGVLPNGLLIAHNHSYWSRYSLERIRCSNRRTHWNEPNQRSFRISRICYFSS